MTSHFSACQSIVKTQFKGILYLYPSFLLLCDVVELDEGVWRVGFDLDLGSDHDQGLQHQVINLQGQTNYRLKK